MGAAPGAPSIHITRCRIAITTSQYSARKSTAITMSELEFAGLIFLFMAYYFVERCLRFLLITHHKTFYEKLQASRKDLVFFGIWMGLLISTFSTPFCVYGARRAWFLWRHSPGEGWSLDPYSKVCMASRAIMWTSELNRLDLYGLYVIHHTGSIVSLLSFIYFEWPTVILFTLYSTLASEIPGDIIWMLSSYLDSLEQISPALLRFKYNLVRFNAFQYTFIRGTGIASVSWMLSTNSPRIQERSVLEQTYGYTLLGLYTFFCVSYVLRQCNSITVNSLSLEITEKPDNPISRPSLPSKGRDFFGPIEIRLGTYPTLLFVPYGLFMGMGFAALVFTSLTLGARSSQDCESLSFALNICLTSAIAFARILSLFMEDGIARLASQPLRTLFRPGFWLYGGFFGAGVGALLSYKFGYVKNFPRFAGSLVVGLPLFETFSRVGCHTYGCCFGQPVQPRPKVASFGGISRSQFLWHIFPYPAVRYHHATHYAATRINPKLLNRPLVPIQLISATLFLLLFLGISLPLSYHFSIEAAGSITLICHAIIRLMTETSRADYRGVKRYRLSATGRMALFQMICATLWLVHIHTSEVGIHASRLDGERCSIQARILRSTFMAILGIVVYGIHIGEVGSWSG